MDNALSLKYADESRPMTLWMNRLDGKYHCFAGGPFKYEKAYDDAAQTWYARVKVSPPEVTSTVSS